MRSLIFSSYRSEDTKRLGSTIEVEHSHVRFLGNLVLNLWDCGGQQSYMDSYMDAQRSQVFSFVGTLIYVFDLVAGDYETNDADHEWEADLRYYKDCVAALLEFSPNAQVFCLQHKMDLVDASRRRSLYTRRVKDLQRATHAVIEAKKDASQLNLRLGDHAGGRLRVHCFATSIWDATLYRAWSCIIHTLIPKLEKLEADLAQLADACSAAEVVIIEKVTFLVVARCLAGPHGARNSGDFLPGDIAADGVSERDILRGFPESMTKLSNEPPPQDTLSESRFERMSELVKQFKMACTCVLMLQRH